MFPIYPRDLKARVWGAAPEAGAFEAVDPDAVTGLPPRELDSALPEPEQLVGLPSIVSQARRNRFQVTAHHVANGLLSVATGYAWNEHTKPSPAFMCTPRSAEEIARAEVD